MAHADLRRGAGGGEADVRMVIWLARKWWAVFVWMYPDYQDWA